jgi:putative nucleotidyltransferase with HDIG domain
MSTELERNSIALPQPVHILVADDELLIREILISKLTNLGYSCESCDSGKAALDLLKTGKHDLLLADLTMPEISGIELLKEALRIDPEIAVILIAAAKDIGTAVDALKDGAYDYITKPFSPQEVSTGVSLALEKRRLILENRSYQRTLEEKVASRTHQLKEALEHLHHTYHSTLVALGTALDSRDADSEGHSLRVTMYCSHLARCLGLTEGELRAIEQGALLHDIGKIGIPDELLRTRRRLDEAETILLQSYVEIGYRILSGIKFLHEAARIVLEHQESFDGTGYPCGLKGEKIHIGARIFALAAALESITSPGQSHSVKDFESARQEIRSLAGTRFDPKVVEAFLHIPAAEWECIRESVTSARRIGFAQPETRSRN